MVIHGLNENEKIERPKLGYGHDVHSNHWHCQEKHGAKFQCHVTLLQSGLHFRLLPVYKSLLQAFCSLPCTFWTSATKREKSIIKIFGYSSCTWLVSTRLLQFQKRSRTSHRRPVHAILVIFKTDKREVWEWVSLSVKPIWKELSVMQNDINLWVNAPCSKSFQ